MASFVLATATRSALAEALKTELAGGSVKIYTAAYAALLVSIPLATPCGSVTDGVLNLDTTNMNANAGDDGVAAVGRFFKSDGTTPVADCDVAVSGATINLQNTNIAAPQNVKVTSGTITVPAGT
jgi:hypothetical protein